MMDGQDGDPPDWFVHIKVAKWLGVAPWDLGRQPVGWKLAAMEIIAAETDRESRDRR